MYDAGSGNVGVVLVPPMCINDGLSSICHYLLPHVTITFTWKISLLMASEIKGEKIKNRPRFP